MGPLDEHLSKPCLYYIADYVKEELDRGNEISSETIEHAIDAFNGGAR